MHIYIIKCSKKLDTDPSVYWIPLEFLITFFFYFFFLEILFNGDLFENK